MKKLIYVVDTDETGCSAVFSKQDYADTYREIRGSDYHTRIFTIDDPEDMEQVNEVKHYKAIGLGLYCAEVNFNHNEIIVNKAPWESYHKTGRENSGVSVQQIMWFYVVASSENEAKTKALQIKTNLLATKQWKYKPDDSKYKLYLELKEEFEGNGRY